MTSKKEHISIDFGKRISDALSDERDINYNFDYEDEA